MLPSAVQGAFVNYKINKNVDSLKVKRSLKDLLSQYYTKINIKNLNLIKGDIKFLEIDSNVNIDLVMSGKLSARLKDFKFDRKQFLLKDRFSYSDNIQFAVDDFQKVLSDKNYQLKVKRLVFSSKDSVFIAKVVRLFPTEKIYNSENIDNVFTVYSPSISTKSTNIGEFINFNILDFGRLTIENPAIALFRKETKNKNKQVNHMKKLGLMELMSKFLVHRL